MDEQSIKILECNSNYLVCIKPVGIPSESPGMPEILEKETGGPLYPVHRLDQGVSGLMIYARNKKAAGLFTKLFAEGNIKKQYLTVVSGIPQEERGIYCDFLYHDKKANKTFVVKKERAGVKKAELEYKAVKTISDGSSPLSLLKINLHTGRSHQIRVQLASRKLPIIGDGKYGSRIKAQHISLLCQSLQFTDPFSHKRHEFTIQMPDEYPWNLFAGPNIENSTIF